MNKIVSMVAMIALASTFSFSQEQEANSSLEWEVNSPQEQETKRMQEQEISSPQKLEGNSPLKTRAALHSNTQILQTDASDYSISFGFVAGGVARLSIIENVLFFSPGLDFMYRNVCSKCLLENNSDYDIEFNAYEFALSAPVLIQLEIFKLYLEGGIQFDLPLTQIYFYDAKYGELSEVKSDREKFDFGYVAGLGWKTNEGTMVGVRGFYSTVGKYGNKDKPKKLIQVELSLVLSIL